MNELREIIAISASFTGGAELRNQLRGWMDMALDIGIDAGTASEFVRHATAPKQISANAKTARISKDFLLAAEIAEGADVGDV